MKKNFLLSVLFCLVASAYAQNNAARFETVLRSGSSIKAFSFVRNYFGLSVKQDPFLHFKERGIKQLISFCDYRTRRIEATSLINFSQTREFWKNYSKQFTAGKWNYKSLYPTDSLAWLAANYSITLIYVHEMGHYMSLRYTHNTAATYTCEEFLANECLAVFANNFNGHKKMDLHKKLFLELARQTAQFTPDSNKTAFETPVKNWCGADPMKAYMHLFEKNDKEFLRFYGYTQFRMMEHALVNYTGERFADFLNRKFYQRFTWFTGKTIFKPLKYAVLSPEVIRAKKIIAPWMNISSSGADSNSFFDYSNLNQSVLMINPHGEIFTSFPHTENIDKPGTEDYPSPKNIFITTQKRRADSVTEVEGWIYAKAVNELKPSILSGWEDKGSFHYIIRRVIQHDSTTSIKYDYYTLFSKGSERFSRQFSLPDSIMQNEALHNELLLAGTNLGFPVIVHNQLMRDLRQHISMYMVDTVNNKLGKQLWNAYSGENEFFNMYAPALYIDSVYEKIIIAFTNPVTERIYVVRIGNAGTQGYEFFNPAASTRYPQQMNFCGISFVTANQLYILAGLPDRADKHFTKVNKLLVKF